jgi:YVTN family beta-propeller protein
LVCALAVGVAGCALGPWKGWTKGPQVDLPIKAVTAMAFGDRSLWLLANADEAQPGRLYRIDSLGLAVVGTPILVGRGSVSRWRPLMVASESSGLWVANSYDGTVSRVDPQTNQVVATIPVRQKLLAVAFGEGAVWVLSEGAASKIDPQTNQVVATIMLDGNGLQHQTLVAGDGAVWIGGAGPWHSTVLQIDAQTNHVVGTVRLPSVNLLRLGVGGGALWASDGHWVARIDPHGGQVVSRVSICVGGPRVCGAPITLDVRANAVWIIGSKWVFRLDPQANRITERYGVVPEAEAVALSQDAVWMLLREFGWTPVKPRLVRLELG